MELFLATPFAGYESPYLERWCLAYRGMADGLEAEALWLYNGREAEFDALLRECAAEMPIPVEVRWEPLPVLGNREDVQKNNAVCMAHHRLHSILRERDPKALVFVQESDVIVPPGGIERLRNGLKAQPAIAALSGAVPEWRVRDPIYVGTMAWRIQPRHEGAYTVPGAGPVVGWYLPEVSNAIEMVDAVPFGALLTKLNAFEEVPLSTRLFPGLGLDQEWSVNCWAAGHPVAIDWSVICGHFRRDFNPAWEDIRTRMTTDAPLKVGLA